MPTKPTDDQRVVKLALNAVDHDAIRLAAALRGTNMTEFARTIVIAEARRLTAGIKRPNRTAK